MRSLSDSYTLMLADPLGRPRGPRSTGFAEVGLLLDLEDEATEFT
jgi:hypothetical protein